MIDPYWIKIGLSEKEVYRYTFISPGPLIDGRIPLRVGALFQRIVIVHRWSPLETLL